MHDAAKSASAFTTAIYYTSNNKRQIESSSMTTRSRAINNTVKSFVITPSAIPATPS